MRAARWALILLGLTPFAAQATVPRDTLVVATQLDDLISLDPAEIFEIGGAEVAANLYRRLIGFEPGLWDRPVGDLAQIWQVEREGRRYVFVLRTDARFASGRTVNAEDVVGSWRRVLAKDKAPAAVLRSIGLSPERLSIAQGQVAIDLPEALAPGLVLAVLASTAASVIDLQAIADKPEGWLGRNSAGAGAFELAHWSPQERVTLRRNPHHPQPATMARIVLRHVAEPTTQRLMLQRGDVDLARNLGPDLMAGLGRFPDLAVAAYPKAALYYLAVNRRRPTLAEDGALAAIKSALDVPALVAATLGARGRPHAGIVPAGFLGAAEEGHAAPKPAPWPAGLTLDVRAAPPTLDLAEAIQAQLAKAGIAVAIQPGDSKTVLTRYRARRHDLVIARWAPDFADPHANAEPFSRNPDNGDAAGERTPAWRNGWVDAEAMALVEQAVREFDSERRAALYRRLQAIHRQRGPFVILAQEVEIVAMRRGLAGLVNGPLPEMLRFESVTKP